MRSDVTVANPELLPEQSVGGELGIAQRWGPFQGRFTGYWNDVKNLVTNVTLSDGNRLAQVPQQGATLSARYENPQWVNVSAMARFTGAQFEDDQNTLRLGSYWVFDLFLSRPIAKWGELYLGIQNLFNTTYSVGRTSDGVVSIGAPRLVHGGIRLSLK